MHTGWTPEETETLFSLAARAQQSGRPLKAVFDEVARETGRQPNSVRNFYYARVKAETEPAYTHKRAFVPFNATESEQLIERVLSAQAEGESVRSCTLRLAGGDDKAMLRYQNKYRAMLKNDPATVRCVAQRLKNAGKPAFDPFSGEGNGRRAGRPRKQAADVEHAAARLVGDLSRVKNLDVHALLDSLGALAVAAVRGAQAGDEPARDAAIREENVKLSRELRRQSARYQELLGFFTQLIRINSEFLSLNSVVKVSNLTSYIHDLERNVRACERVMTQA